MSKMYGKSKMNRGMPVKGKKAKLEKSVGTPNSDKSFNKIVLGSKNRGSSKLTS